MSFTKEELGAVGIPLLGDGSPLVQVEFMSELLDREHATSAHESLVRLALAHPERAADALGEGWSVQATDGSLMSWVTLAFEVNMYWTLKVEQTGRIWLDGYDAPVLDLLPEFLPTVQRAYRIAAAWQRIQAVTP